MKKFLRLFVIASTIVISVNAAPANNVNGKTFSPPGCTAPVAITINSLNSAAGTANISWPAVAGSPGYQWAVNTTNVMPVTGTAVAGTTAAVTGITSGIINYIFVRTNCGGGSFSPWTSVDFAALPCATLLVPAANAANVPQTESFSWTAVAGADSYNLYRGSVSGAEVNVENVSGTDTTLDDLLPQQIYYWYIVPVINQVPAPNKACAERSFTTGIETNTPVNNACSGAIALINGGSVTATTVGATSTLPPSDCGSSTGSPDDDVWFQFTTSAIPNGSLVITPAATGGIDDIVAQVYQASSCSAIGTAVTCSDATTGSGLEQINLSSLAPNTHYFMRVFSWEDGTAVQGAFTVTSASAGALPVTLTGFTARRANGINILNWTTSQELNTHHFTVERSTDGSSFSPIGQVAAAGNSSTVRNYTFTDPHPLKGVNFYRLRIVDVDNKFKLSDIRQVKNDGIADVNIYPNPVKNQLQVAISADKAVSGQLTISDASGKRVYSNKINLAQGSTLLPIAVGNFAAGYYILKIQLNDDVIMKQFSKQ